eukprot:Opistho-2@97136
MADDGGIKGNYNLKNSAVKRILREVKEMQNATDQYYAQPLEDNIFEWHFTLRGPPDSDFTGGLYHGRILLPPEYPFKPPSIMLLTPNGRFETGKKICLSVSAHHPEYWQPSWSIRTVLLAIISFMPTKGNGAIGALDYSTEERKRLAVKSPAWVCSACGTCNKDVLVNAPTDPAAIGATLSKDDADAIAQISFKGAPDEGAGASKAPASGGNALPANAPSASTAPATATPATATRATAAPPAPSHAEKGKGRAIDATTTAGASGGEKVEAASQLDARLAPTHSPTQASTRSGANAARMASSSSSSSSPRPSSGVPPVRTCTAAVTPPSRSHSMAINIATLVVAALFAWLVLRKYQKTLLQAEPRSEL